MVEYVIENRLNLVIKTKNAPKLFYFIYIYKIVHDLGVHELHFWNMFSWLPFCQRTHFWNNSRKLKCVFDESLGVCWVSIRCVLGEHHFFTYQLIYQIILIEYWYGEIIYTNSDQLHKIVYHMRNVLPKADLKGKTSLWFPIFFPPLKIVPWP